MKPLRSLTLLALVPVGTILAILVALRIYWGYWWAPPSVEPFAESLATIDRFTSVHFEEILAPPRAERSGRTAWARAVDPRPLEFGGSPLPRLPNALAARGLAPSTDEPIPDATFDAALRALKDDGWFRADETGGGFYMDAGAHLTLGRDAVGAPLLVAAISSAQESNDHYRYCEVAFVVGDGGELTLLDAQRFWFDRAGMEEDFPWAVAFFAVLITLGVWLCWFVMPAAVRGIVGRMGNCTATAEPMTPAS